MPDRTGAAKPLRVLAFAGARDVVGAAETEVTLDGEACTVDGLWPILLRAHPALAPYKKSIRIAVNGVYADDGDRVAPGDEVALIPPVAGG